jgi:hypothetical protein
LLAHAATAVTNWFQGNPNVFEAQGGAADSYIGANFRNTGSTAATGATISNWLISPVLEYRPGASVNFFTRTVDEPAFPDRLEIRFSPNSGSDVGTTPTDVGTFTTLLGTVNPTLTTTGYPNEWTEFNFNIPVNLPTNGRVAFRYFVTNGGPNGSNSDYIGIDTVRLRAVPAPGSAMIALVGLAPLAGFALRRRVRR